MSRIELVRQAVAEQLDEPHALLALRLLFPPQRVAVSIEDEIRDLYTYPERLNASYTDEWRAIATRAIFERAFDDAGRSDQANLEQYLRYLRDDAIPGCIQDHPELFRSLHDIQRILESDNTVTFPDPGRLALMKLIWPEE